MNTITTSSTSMGSTSPEAVEAEFRKGLAADGYTEVVVREMDGGAVLPDHDHAWDARLMVTAGGVKLTHRGEERHYSVGQWCEVLMGERHAEVYDEGGCTLLIGRRYPANS